MPVVPADALAQVRHLAEQVSDDQVRRDGKVFQVLACLAQHPKLGACHLRLAHLRHPAAVHAVHCKHVLGQIDTRDNNGHGYTELLRNGTFGHVSDDQRDVLGRVARSGDELLELITATLDLSRLESGRTTVEVAAARLEPLLAAIEGEARELLRDKPAVALHWSVADLPVVRTDPAKLKVVVKNLVANAVKFTERGHVALSAEFCDAGVAIVVRDSGIGIAEEALPIIFDAFRQADGSMTRRYGGVGLGLHVVRRLTTMLGGRVVTRYKRDAEQYDVMVQTGAEGRVTPEDIERIFVRGRNDTMVPLSSLVRVREAVSPRELNHFNQRRSVTITANLAPGYSLGEALEFMDATAAKVLKPGYSTELNGVSREYRSSSGALGLVFVLALLFIFLVLSAQFESFVDPFVIMLAVPLSMVGALGAMHLTGGTLNVYSQIGLITLVGLITKHGILIVEFSNQLRQQGRDVHAAVVEAASLRLRPILMTTAAMVLGALPLALATGAGAESRQQIGWVIVGGMSFGTLLTIFVVPTMYTLFARRSIPGEITTPEAPEAADAAPVH